MSQPWIATGGLDTLLTAIVPLPPTSIEGSPRRDSVVMLSLSIRRRCPRTIATVRRPAQEKSRDTGVYILPLRARLRAPFLIQRLHINRPVTCAQRCMVSRTALKPTAEGRLRTLERKGEKTGRFLSPSP